MKSARKSVYYGINIMHLEEENDKIYQPKTTEDRRILNAI